MPRRGPDTAEDRARGRKRAAAFSTAQSRLAERHRDEFTELYREELVKRGLVDHPAVHEVTS